MDLNHARLPIPPLRLTASAARSRKRSGETPVSRRASVPVNEGKRLRYTPGELSGASRYAGWSLRSAEKAAECVISQLQEFRKEPLPLPPDPAPDVPGTAPKIPEELALEIRRLAHDLSNALEIVVQTSYLLTMAELKPPADEWLRMLDSGVQKALALNLDLRTYIKAHSPK